MSLTTNSEPLTAEGFADATDVSRETLDRLSRYADLLGKWQKRVNLVGGSTISDLWRRHMLDSAQLLPLIPATARNLVDFGSGAGFPGLVLAIMGVPGVHLIESNTRKCVFLREAARMTETPVTVHDARIDEISAWPADVITARALAPIPLLLEYAEPYLKRNTVCLFPKGRDFDEELTESYKVWNIRENRYQSITDAEGVIFRLEAISHDPAA